MDAQDQETGHALLAELDTAMQRHYAHGRALGELAGRHWHLHLLYRAPVRGGRDPVGFAVARAMSDGRYTIKTLPPGSALATHIRAGSAVRHIDCLATLAQLRALYRELIFAKLRDEGAARQENA
jgi:hypothetical protein